MWYGFCHNSRDNFNNDPPLIFTIKIRNTSLFPSLLWEYELLSNYFIHSFQLLHGPFSCIIIHHQKHRCVCLVSTVPPILSYNKHSFLLIDICTNLHPTLPQLNNLMSACYALGSLRKSILHNYGNFYCYSKCESNLTPTFYFRFNTKPTWSDNNETFRRY